VRRYGASVADEVQTVVHRAGISDLSPPCRLDVTGNDAAKLLSRVCTRNVEALAPDRLVDTLLLDEEGLVLDDGVVARLGESTYRLSTDGRWFGWLLRHARGLDVRIDDATELTAVLGVEGALAADVIGALVPSAAHVEPDALREVEIGSRRVWVARHSIGPDPGFQLTVPAGDALRLWDALLDAGQAQALSPVGSDALDVLRIEAGRVRRGADYVGARHGPSRRTATPGTLGLQGQLDLDRNVRFVGQSAIEATNGSRVDEPVLVGLVVDPTDLARFRRHDVLLDNADDAPPNLDPVAVYAADGASVVGFATSTTFSPSVRRTVALARVFRDLAQPGEPLRLERAVDAERRSVAAEVVALPFVAPRRGADRRPSEQAVPSSFAAAAT
jgi:aminomethyltransferase